jgi:hypothetical protein
MKREVTLKIGNRLKKTYIFAFKLGFCCVEASNSFFHFAIAYVSKNRIYVTQIQGPLCKCDGEKHQMNA